jgi:hypothetical protein
MGVVLLENPVGQRKLEPQQLEKEIQVLFGVQGATLHYADASGKVQGLSKSLMTSSTGSWLHVALSNATLESVNLSTPSSSGPCCCYVNVESGTAKSTVVLENPRGRYEMSGADLARSAALALGAGAAQVALYRGAGKKGAVEMSGAAMGLHASTVYAEN